MAETKRVEYWVQQKPKDKWLNAMPLNTDTEAVSEANYLNHETKSDTFRAIKRTITEEVL